MPGGSKASACARFRATTLSLKDLPSHKAGVTEEGTASTGVNTSSISVRSITADTPAAALTMPTPRTPAEASDADPFSEAAPQTGDGSHPKSHGSRRASAAEGRLEQDLSCARLSGLTLSCKVGVAESTAAIGGSTSSISMKSITANPPTAALTMPAPRASAKASDADAFGEAAPRTWDGSHPESQGSRRTSATEGRLEQDMSIIARHSATAWASGAVRRRDQSMRARCTPRRTFSIFKDPPTFSPGWSSKVDEWKGKRSNKSR
mmetsp:Transcript_47838/g.154148  ORF Transcript_47838/g.154148 Transcript_47838/m.154148 type:complete len:264 (-) Transcript_47838:1016-1807(-)